MATSIGFTSATSAGSFGSSILHLLEVDDFQPSDYKLDGKTTLCSGLVQTILPRPVNIILLSQSIFRQLWLMMRIAIYGSSSAPETGTTQKYIIESFLRNQGKYHDDQCQHLDGSKFWPI